MGITAGEAGWHKSCYNIGTVVPDGNKFILANLFCGKAAAFTPLEMYLYDQVETLEVDHPYVKRFADLGFIADYDEKQVLLVMGRMGCAGINTVSLTICPTMGCNFDCPYCFEDHTPGKMTQEVQDDVFGLTERMIESSKADKLTVTWFGGEPLLAPDVIESLSERFLALTEEKGMTYSAQIVTNGYLLSQSIADMLGRCKISTAQITLDGIGEDHDKTRYLAGGAPTFERIVKNLRTLKLPFMVSIRHNVHSANMDQIGPLKEFVRNLAEESGNQLRYYYWTVYSNDASDRRQSKVDRLCGSDKNTVSMEAYSFRFSKTRGIYCGANSLYSLGIDEKGNLQKCWEDSDKPEHSFGTAAKWDPKNPFVTADKPDNLTAYLNTCLPLDDQECLDCLWLPACLGGCPNRRLYRGKKDCLVYKDQPEEYALALYRRLQEQKESGK